MALPDNLLTPIPGENPSGKNLRYDPIYDKIKEARRQEEELPSGDWATEIKKADWVQVQKLAVDALATKTKDLQIAAWLTEALFQREGFAGFREGLNLIRSLLENFWDTIYPEIEDGDLELRAAPIEWIGTTFDLLVRKAPLTKSGYNFLQYKESRAVGYEADVQGDENKTAARQAKLDEGKLAPEAWDADVEITRTEFYQALRENIEGTLESLQALNELCDQKFGNVAPGFGRLRTALEEVQHLVNQIWKKKAPPEEEAPAEGEVVEEVAAEEGAPAARVARRVISEEPADKEDAIRRLAGVCKYWRREDPYSPAPYLILRGLRWGELRAGGPSPDMTLFEAPPTEIRQQIKKLSLEGNWAEVLETAETAMALPCGRAWLDLQRYVIRACTELGEYYTPIATAVSTELRGLLADYPQLPEWTLMDDTPTANPETQAWLRTLAAPVASAPDLMAETAPVESEPSAGEASGEAAPPDPHTEAVEAVRAGRAKDGIEILARAIGNERSGRARFQRMVQLAGICLASGYESLAYPILRELAEEIDRRNLVEWESREMVAQPLALYYRCLDRLNQAPEVKQAVYEKLCRLDPVQALAVLR
jgi:type VI secretion system protein ImpA